MTSPKSPRQELRLNSPSPGVSARPRNSFPALLPFAILSLAVIAIVLALASRAHPLPEALLRASQWLLLAAFFA